ncbi:hypothetical protein EVAR_76638_1 [Eumeta japonica]|uniref:Mariner Mos1 transposase n=1 Tax=Eumeta variegata TaxID=151549 RepID=A0A4C1T6A8_EUMVA|nr:hypothetical protein EVAR_76638_1 [Eumeta japonica]
MKLKQEVEKIWPESINRKVVIFYPDNGKPHTYLATQQILRVWAIKHEELVPLKARPRRCRSDTAAALARADMTPYNLHTAASHVVYSIFPALPAAITEPVDFKIRIWLIPAAVNAHSAKTTL